MIGRGSSETETRGSVISSWTSAVAAKLCELLMELGTTSVLSPTISRVNHQESVLFVRSRCSERGC